MPRIQRIIRDCLAASFVAVLSACGDTATGTTGSIVVSVTPVTLSLEQGTGGSLNVNVERTGGFKGTVRLSVTGLPAGITATITPAELADTETSATIAVIVTAAVPAQAYTATITATATGVTPVTITFPFSVTIPPPPGTTDVAYDYCREESTPAFLAYQDGADPWKVVQPTGVNGMGGVTRFAFRLTRARGGVIAVYPAEALEPRVLATAMRRSVGRRDLLRTLGNVRRLSGTPSTAPGASRSYAEGTWVTEVRFASAGELAMDAAENCALTVWPKTAKAVVTGVSAGQYGILSLGSANELFIGGESTNPVTFVGIRNDAVDFVGARLAQPGSPPDRLVVLRNLNIPEGGSLPTIDFNGSTSLPATATATIAGASGDELEMFSEVVTARSGRSLLWFDLAPSVQTSRPWAGLAPATMVNGDFHSVVVFATPATGGDYRVTLKYVEQVSNQALTLGPTVTAPSASVVAPGPYPRLRFRGDLPVEYNKGVEILLGDEEAGNTFSIAVTGAYLAAVGDVRRYDVVMPDVSAMANFPTASRLTPGPNAISFTALGFTGPGVFDLTANLGSEYRAATKAMTVAVP